MAASTFWIWCHKVRRVQEAAKKCMVAAYDAGVSFFDNAEAYNAGRAETIMREILKESGWRRDSYIISSKVSLVQLVLCYRPEGGETRCS